MPQLQVSVDQETAQRIRLAAKSRGLSVSKYLAEILQRELGTGWPPGYLEAIRRRALGCEDSELPRLPRDLSHDVPPEVT